MPATSPPPLQQATTSSSVRPSSRRLFRDLESGRALARDDVRVVEGRHQHGAALRRELRGDLLAALAHPVVLDDFGAQVARVPQLDRGRVGRHHDRRRDAERRAAAATPWAWLPDENATTPAVRSRRVQLHEPVPRAAELERSGVLQRLELEQDAAAGQRVERGVREQRSATGMALEPAAAARTSSKSGMRVMGRGSPVGAGRIVAT